jgi:hypothetical protein
MGSPLQLKDGRMIEQQVDVWDRYDQMQHYGLATRDLGRTALFAESLSLLADAAQAVYSEAALSTETAA